LEIVGLAATSKAMPSGIPVEDADGTTTGLMTSACVDFQPLSADVAGIKVFSSNILNPDHPTPLVSYFQVNFLEGGGRELLMDKGGQNASCNSTRHLQALKLNPLTIRITIFSNFKIEIETRH
jgi:hypothetical protein